MSAPTTTAERVAARYSDSLLALRVATRYLRRADEEADPAKGGVPARWQDWLDAVHEGGRKKVPNPNSETRDRYPDVSYSTALKDKNVFKKAIEDYHEWVKKNPEKDAPKKVQPQSEEDSSKATPPKKEAPSSKPAPKTPVLNLKDPLKVSAADLDKIITKHKASFDKLAIEMKAAVGSYEKNYASMTSSMGNKVPDYAVKEFKELSETEKMLHVAGHRIGALFEKSLSDEDKKLQETLVINWQNSSSNSTSTQVHGALSTLGVEGYQTAKDKEKKMYRDAGMKKQEWKAYMGKVYAFTQAYYKHIGLKEITLYRGVVDKGLDKASVGDEVGIKTRELSSFTQDPKMAAQFGHPLKMKVPVANILWSNLTAPMMTEKEPPGHGEGEISVMGASKIPGKIIGKPANKLMELEGR
jgi:hypothetical protein